MTDKLYAIKIKIEDSQNRTMKTGLILLCSVSCNTSGRFAKKKPNMHAESCLCKILFRDAVKQGNVKEIVSHVVSEI